MLCFPSVRPRPPSTWYLWLSNCSLPAGSCWSLGCPHPAVPEWVQAIYWLWMFSGWGQDLPSRKAWDLDTVCLEFLFCVLLSVKFNSQLSEMLISPHLQTGHWLLGLWVLLPSWGAGLLYLQQLLCSAEPRWPASKPGVPLGSEYQADPCSHNCSLVTMLTASSLLLPTIKTSLVSYKALSFWI